MMDGSVTDVAFSIGQCGDEQPRGIVRFDFVGSVGHLGD